MADIMFNAPVSPATLTNYINQFVPAPAANTLTSLATVRYTPDEYVTWGTITRRNRMAQYRPWDGSIARTTRDTAAEQRIPLAPFSLSTVTSEYETRAKEFARNGGGNKQLLVDAIYNDAEQLTVAMWNRIEKALGDTLFTGRFSVNENLTRYEADYALPAGNRVAPAVPWTDINASAADDLRAMRAQAVLANGVAPGRIITSNRVLSAMQRNVQIVSEAVGVLSGKTRLTRQELIAWLDSESLPTLITEVDGSMWDDTAQENVRVFPDDALVFAPAELGSALEFTFGMSVSALKLRQATHVQSTFGDERIVGMILQDGPPFREYVYTDAVGIPVLTAPQSIVIGEVL